jgi:hypothetical protein
MPKGVSDYDMLRSFQKDELLDDLGDIIAKYVKDPDDIDREIDRFDIGGFDNMSNMVTANLGRDPEYKALAKKFNLNEGDTYEKMAAKGKKAGNLKQGTVRKRLKIKDGEKIPLSKINKAISKIKKMENPSEKNKKFLKALNLAKTLKTTTNVNEEENPVVAKGDGMEITRKEMAMLHKNGKVRLKDGSILTFINKKDKAN